MSLAADRGLTGSTSDQQETEMNSHLHEATIQARIDDFRRQADGRRTGRSAASQAAAQADRPRSIRSRFRLLSPRAEVVRPCV
jgi:hypothetical protein